MVQTLDVPWFPLGTWLGASPQAPFWNALEERLYWLDAPMRRVFRMHLPSAQTEHWALSAACHGLVPCSSGGFLLLQADGIYHAGSWCDVPSLLVAWPHTLAHRPWQAGRCDPWGRLWLVGPPPPTAPVGSSNALYCLRARSTTVPALALVRQGIGDGLSLTWAAHGQALYWCNPRQGEVQQALMAEPQQWPPVLAMPMPWVRFPAPAADWTEGAAPTSPYAGWPQALTLDQDGHCWVGLAGSGYVFRLDAQGQCAAQAKLPALSPLALCMGGLDGRTLFVCTGRAGRSAAEIERFPLSGSVLACSVDSTAAPALQYWD